MATNNSVTFNRLITDKAEGLMEDTRDFVAMRAFGVATVAKRMGEYPKFKIEDLYRNSLRKRAVGAQYAETATDIEMVSFVWLTTVLKNQSLMKQWIELHKK